MTQIAYFDIDKTLYKGYSTSDAIVYLVKHGIGSADIILQLLDMEKDYMAGLVSYTDASKMVVECMATLIQGQPVGAIQEHLDTYLQSTDTYFSYTLPLIDLLQRHDVGIYLISAGASPIAEAIARSLACEVYASKLSVDKNNTYDGSVEYMLNDDAKRETMMTILSNNGDVQKTLAIGDSSGDVPMLNAVDEAFLVNATDKDVLTTAKRLGWHIANEDTLLELVESTLTNVS